MSALTALVRERRPLDPATARAIRMAAGISQVELAQELGIHPVTVARWEAGTRRPDARLLPRYRALLDELREATT